jgi:glycosyltransferase involved in cell wall biosynthesis
MEIQEKINILFWRTGFYGALTVGGFGTLYQSITNEFLKRNHKVHFASGGLMDLHPDVDYHLIEYSKLLRNFPEVLNFPYNHKSSKEILKLIKNHKIDLLYLQHHDFHYGLDLLKKKTNIPILLQIDSIEQWVKQNWGGKLYFKNMINWCEEIEVQAADAILVISETVKNQLTELYDIDQNKIFISPSGVDTDKFNPSIKGEDIRAKYGLSNTDYVIGYSGLFNLYHGIDTLVKSIPTIVNEIKNVKFLLIGDGQLRPEIDNFVEKNHLEHLVTITGLVPYKDVPQHLAACDILVSPFNSSANTTFFNSPIKTFEYMAMGKPIVTTNIGELKSICIDSENSIVMDEGSFDSLAQSILRLKQNDELRTKISQNARDFVVKNFSWSNKYDLIMEVYNNFKNKK